MNRTRALTEGSILGAIYVILLLAVFYIPILNILLMFTLATPFIIYAYRYHIKQAIILFIVTLFLTYLTTGISAIMLTFTFGTAGIVMGYFYKRSQAFTILIAGSLTFIANLLIGYSFTVFFFQINFMDMLDQAMTEAIDSSQRFLPAGENSAEQIQLLYDQLDMVQYIIPFFLIAFGVSFAFFTQVVANKILKRLNGKFATFPPFKDLSFPKSVLWYYLVVIVLSFFNYEKGSMMFIIVINGLYLLRAIMFVQGLSFVFSYFHQKGWNKGLAYFISVIALFQPLFHSVVEILGIIDLGFHLRKRINEPKK